MKILSTHPPFLFEYKLGSIIENFNTYSALRTELVTSCNNSEQLEGIGDVLRSSKAGGTALTIKNIDILLKGPYALMG